MTTKSKPHGNTGNTHAAGKRGKTYAEPSITVSVRLPEALAAALKAEADRESVSVNKFIVATLQAALAEHG